MRALLVLAAALATACTPAPARRYAAAEPAATSAAPLVDARPPPDAAPEPSPPDDASAGSMPLFTMRTIERDSPTIRYGVPEFRLPDGATNAALSSRLARDADKIVAAFERSVRDDGQRWFLLGGCEPTLVRPRIVSMHCHENRSIAGTEVAWGTNRTYAMDGANVRELSVLDFFKRPATRPGGFLTKLREKVLAMRTCSPLPKIDDGAVGRAIEGVAVDDDGMNVIVGGSRIGFCGGPFYEVTLTWSELEGFVDPAGPITRLERTGSRR